jgi:hypothetical protein
MFLLKRDRIIDNSSQNNYGNLQGVDIYSPVARPLWPRKTLFFALLYYLYLTSKCGKEELSWDPKPESTLTPKCWKALGQELQGVPKKWKNKKTSSLLLHIIHFLIKKNICGAFGPKFLHYYFLKYTVRYTSIKM